MLWLIPADTHEQTIGIMSHSQAFSTHRRPTTSVSATRVSPRLPAMLIGVSLAEIAGIEARRFPRLGVSRLYVSEPGAVPSRPEGAPQMDLTFGKEELAFQQ